MHYVYVLINPSTKRLYIGFTSNLERRIDEHRYKKVKSTKYWPKFELIFYEAFKVKDDGIRRELYLKSTKGKRTLRLMLNSYFDKDK